jgi:hypothetical protein
MKIFLSHGISVSQCLVCIALEFSLSQVAAFEICCTFPLFTGTQIFHVFPEIKMLEDETGD